MKNLSRILVVSLLFILIIGCSKKVEKIMQTSETASTIGEDYIVIGFSQLGAESDWRTANTESMKNTFTEENGYKLIIEDGQQKQTNQIAAIRTFIQQKVDYIVLAPVTETGWDTVLKEAKDAGIPVIIVDRMVSVSDDSLFTCWVGSNFRLEAEKISEWLKQYVKIHGIDSSAVNVVDVQGTIGASAQIGRTNGLLKAVKKNGWNLLASANGEFTEDSGKKAMEQLLLEYDNISVVYCHNDNEALGAIDAIERAGKKVGSDILNGEIMVLSFDGVNIEAINYVKEDKITCIAECNPNHGPRVEAIIKTLIEGGSPEKYQYVEGGIFTSIKDVTQITVNGVSYEVKILE